MGRKNCEALSDEDREARRAAERELMADAVAMLMTSEGWKRWLQVRRHFHAYSFHNQLLIALQCPDATRVAGFRAWLKLGYCVRKGERAIRIWAKRALLRLMQRSVLAVSVPHGGDWVLSPTRESADSFAVCRVRSRSRLLFCIRRDMVAFDATRDQSAGRR